MYLVPLEHASTRRPDLSILNDIRKRIIVLANGDLRIFQLLHKTLLDGLDRAIMHAASGRMGVFHDAMDADAMHEIQAKLREEGIAELGSRLDATFPFDQALIGMSFFQTRAHLLSVFNAQTEHAHVRRIYDDVLYAVFSQRVFNTIHGMNAPMNALDVTDQEEINLQLLQYGRNTECTKGPRNMQYPADPILTHADIREITSEVGDNLRKILRDGDEGGQLPTIIGGLETLDRDKIHALPRRHAPPGDSNKHSALSHSALPKNEFATTPEAGSRIEKKKALLREHLIRLEQKWHLPPIIVIRFVDCATNRCLSRRLEEICGGESKKWIRELRVDFDPKADDPQHAIRHWQHQLGPQLRDRLGPKRGGIFVVGGSWNDAYDMTGTAYKQKIGESIVDAVAAEESLHRLLGICFGAQTTADILGDRSAMDSIRTEPGCMEFCPSSIRVVEQSHPLFRDCPTRMTLAQTHSGHVFFGTNKQNASSVLRPIARSGLTGLPIAYDALDGRVIGLQAHPEVRIKSLEDRAMLMEELAEFDTSLEQTFGVKAEDLNRMWSRAAEYVVGEAGHEVLLNALLALSESIVEQLDAPKESASPVPPAPHTSR